MNNPDRSFHAKVSHTKQLTLHPALGILLDQIEEEKTDIEKGTFFGLFRYSCVHFEQNTEPMFIKGELPEPAIRERLLGN
jgi:hypothetical protein